MTATGHTVTAMTANHVSFSADNFSHAEILYVTAHLNDLPDKLVPHHQRDRDGITRPIIPFIDMEIGAADARTVHLDEHITRARLGLRHVLEPKSFSRLFFNECLHLSCKKDFHVMDA